MSQIPLEKELSISTDKLKLNVEFIYKFLTDTYWAKGRTLVEVQQTIDNSLCFGVYLGDEQIGFARVVTDTVVFAYLMDVFIDPQHRSRGYSKLLMKTIIACKELKDVRSFYLKTSDAHGLYTQFGFQVIADPECFMERKNF